MTGAATIAWLAALAFFLASLAAALLRRPRPLPAPAPAPCTIIMPIKGAASYLARNLAALAAAAPRDAEIIFAVADARDPAHALAAPLAAAEPDRIRLLTGEAAEFANPKLSNVAKAYRAARHDVILFFDDTSAADADLIAELRAGLDGGARAITAVPLGVNAATLSAAMEAATWNGHLQRVETLLDLVGKAAGFGNAFAFRKSDLEAAGGLARLAEGPCEDNALARALRGLGGPIRLARRPVLRPIGPRNWRDTALRHLRWKNCSKCHDPGAFLVEIAIGGLAFNLLGAVALGAILGVSWWGGLGMSAALWYGGELALTLAKGWPLDWRVPPGWLLRDLAHPLLTVAAAFTRSIDWQGTRIDVRWRWPARR